MNELFFDSRTVLIYLAVRFMGDYDKMLAAIISRDYGATYEEAQKVVQSLPCKTLTYMDYDYPEKLKRMHHPPLVLFYYGDISLLDIPNIAVVGSREFTEYGKYATEAIVSKIIKGKVLISGLARGIDTIAHKAAIENGGRTIAVLGSGIDYCYPAENQELYEEIKKNHLLISEYPFKAEPDKEHFPLRNRIIVGLADALYVPQVSTYMSGTMISVNLALTIGTEIFVAPYPMDAPVINNRLLNEGATLVESPEQMMIDLKWADK